MLAPGPPKRNKLSRNLLLDATYNYRLWALWFQTRICLCVPYISLHKNVTPRWGHFWQKGHNLNILGRGLLGDAT